MTSIAGKYRQTVPRTSTLRTAVDTAWIYPETDVEYALAHTAWPFTRVGNVITAADISGAIGIALNIFDRTAETQPLNNVGYALGKGTILSDMGNDFRIMLPSGEIVFHYRLFRQITPQENPPIPSPASDTPNGTIGYGIVFTALGTDAGTAGYLQNLDPVRFTRTG